MCRMFALFGESGRSIPRSFLEKFIKTCHWGKWRQGDFIGHHGMGWGVLWLDKSDRIRTFRSLLPIWRSNWRALLKLNSRCIVVHARFCPPWAISSSDVHPITENKRLYMFHNGIIATDSIPPPEHGRLKKKFNNTGMDTRRYLLSLQGELESAGGDLGFQSMKKALDAILPNFNLKPSANAFIVTPKGLGIVEYMKQYPIFKRQTYVLNMSKISTSAYCVSVIPFDDTFVRIPNHAAVYYDFQKNSLNLAQINH